MTENFIDKSPTRTKCLAYPAANQDPVARPSRGWPVQGIAQAIGAVAQGAARATMTTANGVRGQLRPSSIRFLVSAVVTQTCLMGSVQGAELTAGVPSVATPQATQFGEVTVVTKGTIAYGTIIRADDGAVGNRPLGDDRHLAELGCLRRRDAGHPGGELGPLYRAHEASLCNHGAHQKADRGRAQLAANAVCSRHGCPRSPLRNGTYCLRNTLHRPSSRGACNRVLISSGIGKALGSRGGLVDEIFRHVMLLWSMSPELAVLS